MRSFLLKFGLFALLALFLYPAAVVVVGEVETQLFDKTHIFKRAGFGNTYDRLQEAKSVGEVDVLILGSSHAYRGFDTRIFEAKGKKVFNLGSSSQSHIQTQLLLQRYLHQLKPEVVIYEVYPGMLASTGVESTVDLLSNDYIDWPMAKMALTTKSLKAYNTLCFGLYRQWRGQVLPANKKEEQIDTYITGGYVQRADVPLAESEPKDKSTAWKIVDAQFVALAENINLLEGEGAEVYLVQAPIRPDRFAQKTNNSEFDSLFVNLASYKNYNGPEWSAVNFYDSHHLKHEAVQRLSREVLQDLQSLSLLPQ